MRLSFLCRFAVFSLLCVQVVWCDQVYLQNGDRISGAIIEMVDEQLHFETEYAGRLVFAWDNVESLETDDSITLLLDNGDILTGGLSHGEEAGSVILHSQVFGELVIPLYSIATISSQPVEEWMTETRVAREAVESVSAELEASREEIENLSEQLAKATDLGELWSGAISLMGSARTGNRESYDIFLRTRAKRATPDEELTLLAEFGYGELQNRLQTQEARVQTYLRLLYWEDAYLFGDLNLEHKFFEDIQLRADLTGGAGYYFWKLPDTELSADIGGGLTQEFYRSGGDDLQPSLRLGSEFRQRVFEKSEFRQLTTLFPRMGQIGEFRLVSLTSFSSPLMDSLSWTLDLRNEYNTRPRRAEIKKHDLTVRTGLQYNF